MLTICDHPLINERLNQLRDNKTHSANFRQILRQISIFLTYEACRDFQTQPVTVQTPLESFTTRELLHPSPIIVSILRAGNGLLDGALDVLPHARIGFLGLYRDEESLRPVEYYSNLPKGIETSPIIVVDPMLATGHSAKAAMDRLFDAGAKDVRLISLVAAPEGVKTIHDTYPDLPITLAALDRELNEKGYILPGLGDAGDRIYNSQ